MAQAQRLQDIEADADFFDRIGGERDADGVADAGPEQGADADRGLHRAGHQAAGLGHAEMERVVAGFGKTLIRRDGEEDVGGFHADLEFVEIVVLQDARVVERAFDHRLGTRFAVALEQVAFERAGVDADAHRDAVILRGLHDLAHARRWIRCCPD